MEQKTKPKGLIARILGEQPTQDQKTIVRFMFLALLFWPIGFFVSIFFWDAPIRSSIDEICRRGAMYTIWLYPIYLIPLIWLWFKLSKKLGRAWLFNLCPFIPAAVFCLFLVVASSSFAESKPEGYDPSTYKRLNELYTFDVNHVYYRFNSGYKILEGADPSTFKALSVDYAADMHHVWFNYNLIEGADPATFVLPDGDILSLGFALAHDAHDYYMGKVPLHVANMGSFRLIDSNNEFYAVDSKCVYYKNNIVEGADPASFAVLKGEDDYGQDKHHVYYEGTRDRLREKSRQREHEVGK